MRCALRLGKPRRSRNVKADALYAFVKGMCARRVPINAVGMQTHWGAWWNYQHPAVDPSSVGAQMKRLADLGLDVYITEMDVAIQKPVTAAKLAAQAETYRQVMSTCLAAANCKGFTVFGTVDSQYSEPPWLAHTGSNQQGQWTAPLLFDEALRSKPVYDALAAALRAR
jgi:endo-1,4-beta-xylanase